MSMDRCTKCDALIDTDYFPEFYREDPNTPLICDACWEDHELNEDNHDQKDTPNG